MRWLVLAMAMTVQTWTPDRHTHDASDVTTGTLGAAQLPNPGAGTKGGVSSLTCATSYEHGALDTSSAEAEATEVTGSTGGGGAHNNLQPYIVVYMWKRTS